MRDGGAGAEPAARTDAAAAPAALLVARLLADEPAGRLALEEPDRLALLLAQQSQQQQPGDVLRPLGWGSLLVCRSIYLLVRCIYLGCVRVTPTWPCVHGVGP